MKIAWLANSIPGTGGGRYYMELSNRFKERHGHEVTFFLQDMGNDFGEQVKSPIKHIAQWRDGGVEWDIAICGDPGRGHVVGYVFDGMEAKKKIWCMNFYNEEFKPWVSNSNYIKLAQTTYFLEQACIVDRTENVRLCQGGVDTKFWSYYDGRRGFGLLVYPKKSGYTAIEAIKKVCKMDSRCFMMRFGGEEAQWIDYHFKDIRCENVGAPAVEVNKIREAYQRAYLYINAESYAGWGFSQCVAEAMSCGCTVVGGDSDCFKDMMIDGKTALTVPNRDYPEIPDSAWYTRPDPDKLVDKILHLVNHQEERNMLAANARKHIEQFDYDIMADKFNKVIME